MLKYIETTTGEMKLQF